MAIDLHSHWIPQELLEVMRRRTVAPYIAKDETGREQLYQPRGAYPLPPEYGDIELRLQYMDEAGIDACALSISGVFGVERLPVQESFEIGSTFANAISKLHEQYPQRIFGLGSLPIGDMDLAVAEFERILSLPGIIGTLIPGNAFLTLESAEPFRPLFEVAQKHKAHILVHTGFLPNDKFMPVGDGVDNARSRRVTLDMQSRISSNMITLCMTDFLEPYPDVTVQCHNLGGNIPFEVDRLDHISLDREPDLDPPSVKIRNSKVMVDCNSMGARSIERAVEVYGASRIVFGTDGTNFGAKWSRNAIREARISESEKQSILTGNAQAIIAL